MRNDQLGPFLDEYTGPVAVFSILKNLDLLAHCILLVCGATTYHAPNYSRVL